MLVRQLCLWLIGVLVPTPVLALGAAPCLAGQGAGCPGSSFGSPARPCCPALPLGMWSVRSFDGALTEPPSCPLSIRLGLQATCTHVSVPRTLGRGGSVWPHVGVGLTSTCISSLYSSQAPAFMPRFAAPLTLFILLPPPMVPSPSLLDAPPIVGISFSEIRDCALHLAFL